ncbi:phospholipase D family protein [Paenalcaligenes niemegkensis]|uniref:phospholipase D family protein n=1 Tax=Paenalcaligenes niemegkensis TaxID=2895469 RepID=UPI001EE7DEE1|nr:phospholipase D family protein [Paenalcaligenes niemegkensis]
MKSVLSSPSPFVFFMLVGLLAGCSLPSLEGRPSSLALNQAEAEDTALGRAIRPQAQAHPGKSGIYSLADAHDAFAARVLLTRSAQKTLDVQYYIWHGDITGTLLLEELHAAAERGVRVRLLLDDNGTVGLDKELAGLHTHPNIEIRLFNPFVVRKPKAIGFLTNFMRANRRMHNKSLTADNQATIIGGRNVGDEYFGAGEAVLFADLDVMAVGKVVNDVSLDFDRYWESESSYPVDLILPDVNATVLQELRTAAEAMGRSEASEEYTAAIKNSAFITHLLEGKLVFEWADTRMVSDDPAKGLGTAKAETMLIYQLGEMLGQPSNNVELISPYFVPTAAGVDVFTDMAQAGVKLRILTNSLDATDVAAVHAGYAKRRKDLLQAGIKLYELRRVSPEIKRNESAGPFGSSGSSLHAKTFAVDDERIFVGSFNFDPRSALLNTELGFVIESPSMARQIGGFFDEGIPQGSYEVRLSESGKVYWIEQRDGKPLRHDTEPETSLLKRGFVRFLSVLPIEWLL